MKKATAFLLVLICIAAICGSCASKTPDVIESEEKAAITIDTLDWSLEVEGGNVDTYTLADAKKHPFSKQLHERRPKRGGVLLIKFFALKGMKVVCTRQPTKWVRT
ncbi:MAG: hypothetical protein MJ141_00790 [Clostridia bacterium]|nr:hypothetical protein [Clostridia bacterium]